MIKRICAVLVPLVASVALAAPANADGPSRHPMVPNEMPRIIHCVKKAPSQHVPAWVRAHFRWSVACR